MATTTTEHVSGQLVGATTNHTVKLKLTIREVWVKGSDLPVARVLEDIKPLSLSGIKDGIYTLKYPFNGKQEEQAVRIVYGFMLGG